MHPDPTICRVGRKYYLATSTFAYAPGVPVFESDDLLHWQQIGNVLDRESQMDYKDMEMSDGTYAPTLRYHDGIFYMITTNPRRGGNYYVTAEKPEGPWSEPVFLPEAEGIDSSLYFEGDRCYYIGQRTKRDAQYYGDCEIWICELDLKQGKLVGEMVPLWDGAAKHAIWPEGPHLYKKDDWYYLVIAEGGTAHEHSVSVARSRELFGPYEACKNNPVFTHRHLGMDYPIQYMGHTDLVETEEGSWYAVMLGVRMLNRKGALGRETFLVPVTWEDDWPVFAAGEGRIPVTDATFSGKKEKTVCWQDDLDLSCVMLRKILPKERRRTQNGKLYLRCSADTLSGTGNPSYIGVRVEEYHFDLSTVMEFAPLEGEEAGLAYFYNAENYLTLSVCRQEGRLLQKVCAVEKGREKILLSKSCKYEVTKRERYELRMEGRQGKMTCIVNGEQCAREIPLDSMTTEEAGGFIGCTMGVFAVAADGNSETQAVFDRLDITYQ
jgi:alpha-N-arabinofuranosidase